MNTDKKVHKPSRMKTILKIALPLAIIGVGLLGGRWLYMTRPQPQKATPKDKAPLVRVEETQAVDHRVQIPAMGKVVPARQITLNSRVAGEVIQVAEQFIPGGNLEKGQEILRIDPSDHRLKLAQAESDLVEAEYSLRVEQGKQNVAQREWELLSKQSPEEKADPDLALRRPHLRKAKADIKRAEAKLEQARLDLERTRIKAPFNAIVKDKKVDLGSRLSAQGEIAELVGTDHFWIRVQIPTSRLNWFDIPGRSREKGAAVEVEEVNGAPAQKRQGRVVRLLSDLEEEGRMARVLVRIDDPLNLKQPANSPPILTGSFARVHILGKELKDVVPIPRDAWRDNNQIWLADPEDRLVIRSAEPIWKGSEYIYIPNDIADGHRLVVSDIPAPAEGMKLRITGEAD
ncbi:MAG: efflux RND transporter periplasmic adaptor subunit [Desulfonatronovibrionaceae bacterium]